MNIGSQSIPCSCAGLFGTTRARLRPVAEKWELGEGGWVFGKDSFRGASFAAPAIRHGMFQGRLDRQAGGAHFDLRAKAAIREIQGQDRVVRHNLGELPQRREEASQADEG